MSEPEHRNRGWQYAGVGCVTAAAGFFGGGMIGVFVGWIVGHLTGCRPAEGFPICNFHLYWVPGMFIGAVLLPAAAISRLRQSGDGSPTRTEG
jgi:hypothetical protein